MLLAPCGMGERFWIELWLFSSDSEGTQAEMIWNTSAGIDEIGESGENTVQTKLG